MVKKETALLEVGEIFIIASVKQELDRNTEKEY